MSTGGGEFERVVPSARREGRLLPRPSCPSPSPPFWFSARPCSCVRLAVRSHTHAGPASTRPPSRRTTRRWPCTTSAWRDATVLLPRIATRMAPLGRLALVSLLLVLSPAPSAASPNASPQRVRQHQPPKARAHLVDAQPPAHFQRRQLDIFPGTPTTTPPAGTGLTSTPSSSGTPTTTPLPTSLPSSTGPTSSAGESKAASDGRPGHQHGRVDGAPCVVGRDGCCWAPFPRHRRNRCASLCGTSRCPTKERQSKVWRSTGSKHRRETKGRERPRGPPTRLGPVPLGRG